MLCRQFTYDGFLQLDASLDVLEPHAGEGSFAEAMRDTFPKASIPANDVVDARELCMSKGAADTRVEDVHAITRRGEVDGIIGNPPYTLAEEHTHFALENVHPWYGGGGLPASPSFLESAERGVKSKKYRTPFWKEHPVARVYVLSERPSFTGKGTDSNAYGFLVWQNRRVMCPTGLELNSRRWPSSKTATAGTSSPTTARAASGLA